MTFDEYVLEWEKLASEVARRKAEMDDLVKREQEMRREFSKGLTLEEGTNKISLGDGRTLVITNTIERKVDEGSIALARTEYEKLNERPVEFDTLLRIKYEVDKRQWNKLTDAGRLAVSRMIENKPQLVTAVIK